MSTTLITNAKIIDGTGNPWFYGDVLLDGDRIAAITPVGASDPANAATVIDAGGKVVCPGFIDIQSHAILPLMVDGRLVSKLTQGITTEIMGEAWTPAPVTGRNTDPLAETLFVLDIGAEYGMYTADITRTIPISGKFTKEQKAIYSIVLEAQDAGIAAAVVGASFRAPNMAAYAKIQEGLQKLGILKEDAGRGAVRDFLPHGVSHYLGLDVHDVGTYGNLQVNDVITVEPGIYISESVAKKYDLPKAYWNIGVRIEDDVLITDNGPELLSFHAPRKPEEIEKVMAGK